MIVINGQFPGPLIEANWGDWIEVNVHNEITGPEDLTMLHWHGLNQPGTPYMDGVSSVSQCPIVPGGNLTYRFRADEHGSTWYHAHYSAQYVSGVYGPMVIHGPNDVPYDEDLGPILVSDWYHDSYEHIVDLVMQPTNGPPFRPVSDSNLVGGKGQFPCENVTSGAPCTVNPYASWEIEPGKTYRARFINTGATAFETISLDGHTFTVIANDMVPIQPYDTDFVTIGVGQRVDVVFTASAGSGSFWLRAFNSPCGDTNGSDGRGIIYYKGTDPSTPPTSQGKQAPENPFCQNDPLSQTVPQYVMPAAEPDMTITLTIGGAPDEKGIFRWTFNDITYEGDLDTPNLFEAIAGIPLPPSRNVYLTDTHEVVRIIVINTLPAPHPMHIHGHDFQVLAEGTGTWDGVVVNPSNPQRRDVQMSHAGADRGQGTTNYIVIQYEQDNPGVWPFHCHIAWHLSAGMSIMLMERPAEIAKIEVPSSVKATCDAYKAWEAANPHIPVDEGLRKRDLAKRMVDFMKGHTSHSAKHQKRGYHGFSHQDRHGAWKGVEEPRKRDEV
ncbi:hypothetical protein, variant 2 [Exophiala mesophila]|nr:hypothetical protein, variant 2 [Exophiala mesophila]KIV88988.1 hypothetical protein, variant 2 [Exophiala mesophila]